MGKNTGVGRGGKRPGAGRKSAEEAGTTPMEKHTLTMTAEDAELLRELGGGLPVERTARGAAPAARDSGPVIHLATAAR